MCRTTLNVTGDLVAATVVSAGEKDWDLAEHDPDISAEEKMARLPETQDQ
jgi:Na+/H+-dicarboxylate symporter